MKPAVLLPAAAADVEEAYAFYQTQSEGLGDEFLSMAGAAIERLCRDPEAAPPVFGGVRRQCLRSFPHSLFYRVRDGQLVVIACFGACAGPRSSIPQG